MSKFKGGTLQILDPNWFTRFHRDGRATEGSVYESQEHIWCGDLTEVVREEILKRQRGNPYHIYLPRTLSRESPNALGDAHVTDNSHFKNETMMVTLSKS